MAKNRKYYRHNDCLFVTSRTEEGLPMVPTSVMNLLLSGILAKATHDYQIRICHYLFMANHFHMVLVVDNPEHVSGFLRYVKSETAHAINRLLNRRRKTVWLQGSDSPIILAPEDVIRYITYIYLNPTKANLVERIEQYPGISSWKMFFTGNTSQNHKKIPRSEIAPLPLPSLTIREQEVIARQYLDLECQSYQLKLEPYAWVNSFPELKEMTHAELKERIIEEVRTGERQLESKRRSEQKQVAGATALKRQSMLKEHTPSKHSKRMICLCSDIDLRKEFISFYRSICEMAKDVYSYWKIGNLKPKIPPGLLCPRLPSLVSALT